MSEGSRVLDVGCGIGGTSRYLASQLGCTVTGITISGKQVEIATRLTKAEAAKETAGANTSADVELDTDGFLKLGKGRVKFIELDAEKMGEFFAGRQTDFDAVWISEALSHFPNKALFFQNAHKVLRQGGKLVLADWFKGENLGDKEFENDIKPIEGESLTTILTRARRDAFLDLEDASFQSYVRGILTRSTDGMLLPPLCTQPQYVGFATESGLKVFGGPKDISKDVSKTRYGLYLPLATHMTLS